MRNRDLLRTCVFRYAHPLCIDPGDVASVADSFFSLLLWFLGVHPVNTCSYRDGEGEQHFHSVFAFLERLNYSLPS